MAVNAFAAGDGKQPRGKDAARIELFYALESLHQGVLSKLVRIGGVAAELGYKRVDPMFVTINELFESSEGAGLRLAGQLLVGD